MQISEMTISELWQNFELAKNYQEGTDASHLIGKHFCYRNRFGKLMVSELTMIPINKITCTSENMAKKKPIYKNCTTQAPPVDVTIEDNGTYRLFNGHRRLKSAIARGEKFIFAEIHGRTYDDICKK